MSWSTVAACLVPKLAGSAVHMRTGQSPAVSGRLAATCLVPDILGSTVHMRTGRSQAMSRHPVVAYPVTDMLGSAFRMQTGRLPAVSRLPAADRPGPGVGGVCSSYVGRFGLAPSRGASRRGCPKSRAPNCSYDGGGGGDFYINCLYDVYYIKK